jgi:glycosyltransferase involved in cell wall biosynthesis
MSNKLDQLILGLEKRKSGAYEHAWNVAKNLSLLGFNTKYYAKGFDIKPKRIYLSNFIESQIDMDNLKNRNGVFHLHTHAWESEGITEAISENPNSKLVYTLHAIIPYYYLPEDKKNLFLEGKVGPEIMIDIINNKMTARERLQLDAIEKSDYLIAISEGHKLVLEKMGIEKPIQVLENVVSNEFDDLEIIEHAKLLGGSLREDINAENVLLYCRKLCSKKESNTLINSFSKIREKYPNTKLILLGVNEEHKFHLVNLGLRNECLEDIVFTPWIDKDVENGKAQLLKYYFASDVLIQPMITDGLYSKAVIDAMKIGLPSITCKSPYTIGTSKSADEIFEAFNYLKTHPLEVKVIMDLAKEKVERENNWDYYISKLNQLVNS